MSKHTPGPWRVERPYTITGPIENHLGATRWPIAEVAYRDPSENNANAALIAAAPQLLDACKAQHQAIDLLFTMLATLKPDFFPTESDAWAAFVAGVAAIENAEGRP